MPAVRHDGHWRVAETISSGVKRERRVMTLATGPAEGPTANGNNNNNNISHRHKMSTAQ